MKCEIPKYKKKKYKAKLLISGENTKLVYFNKTLSKHIKLRSKQFKFSVH